MVAIFILLPDLSQCRIPDNTKRKKIALSLRSKVLPLKVDPFCGRGFTILGNKQEV